MKGLRVRGLTRSHPEIDGGRRQVLHGLDLALDPGTSVAVLGRSGCGKTTLLRALLLLDAPGPQDRGEILLDGQPVRHRGVRALRPYRRAVQYVPQEAVASLHPRCTVITQITRPLRTLGVGSSAQERTARAEGLLERLDVPRAIWTSRPHQISGGQAQRVAIARALAPRPHYLLLDEPVSGLDPALRRQVLDLLARIEADDAKAANDSQETQAQGPEEREDRAAPAADPQARPDKAPAANGAAPAPAVNCAVPAPAANSAVPAPAANSAVPAPALLVVSHDLAAVARICRRGLVMDRGLIVEDAPMSRLLTQPSHPASRALRDAVPSLPGRCD